MAYDWKKAAVDHTLIAKIEQRARDLGLGPDRSTVGATIATAHFCGLPVPLRKILNAPSAEDFAYRIISIASEVSLDYLMNDDKRRFR